MKRMIKSISNRAKVAILSTLVLFVLSIGLGFIVFYSNKYTINYDQFQAVVGVDEEVSLEGIKIKNKLTNAVVNLSELQVVRCDSTSTIGNKVLIVKHKKTQYVIHFDVKYKIQFKVDDRVINTQYVLNKDEVVFPAELIEAGALSSEDLTKEGYEFIAWNQNLPNDLNGNIELKAILSSTTLEIPKLETIETVYGTQLKDIDLPENENGRWVFVDNLTNTVGNVGNHNLSVKFEPSTTELVAKYNEVKVNVKKKNLSFNIVKDEFTYDGLPHFTEYTLPADVNVLEIGTKETNASSNAYSYTLIVQDSNYSGNISGTYKINKANVNVVIGNKESDWGNNFTMPYEVENFENKSLLDLEIFTTIKSERYEIDYISSSKISAGEYEVSASSTNNNIELNVTKGRLVVNKVDLKPAPINPVLSTKENPVAFGDTLSKVTFEGHYSNGSWSWKEPSKVIDAIENFKAIAVFSPNNENYNTIYRELTIENINKKKLNITIINNEFTYDKSEHKINYQIEGAEDLNLVVENDIKATNAGVYPTTLNINDKFYCGSIETVLIINKVILPTNFSTKYETTWFDSITLATANGVQLEKNYVWKNPNTSLDKIGTFKFEAQFVPDDVLNYEIINGQFEVTINKQDSEILGVEPKYEFVYTGNEHTLPNILTSHYTSTLKYDYSLGGAKVESLINAGEYVVTITLPESDHYNEKIVSTSVIIKKATSNVMLQTLTATYEDTLANVVLPEEESGVWNWQDDDSTSVGLVGNQTFVAIFTPYNVNIEQKIVNAKIQVKQKNLILEASKTVYTYDGKAHQIEYTLKDANGKDYDLTILGNNPKVNAGTYQLTLTVENINYFAKKTFALIINKAVVAPQHPSNLKATYLDKLNSVALPKTDIGEWKWNEKEDTMVGKAGINSFNAVFIVKEQNGLDNYQDYYTRLSVTVNKKQVITPTLATNEAIYTGKTISASVPKSDLYSETINGWVNVGNYKLELTLNDSSNYIWDSGDEKTTYFDFTINQAQAKITNFVMVGWTFGEKANEPSAISNFGTVKFVYYNNKNEAVETATAAGTYKVKAFVEGTENYSATEEELTFIIKQAEIEIPKIDSVTYTGNTFTTTLPNTEQYFVKNVSGVDAKTYKVVLKLTDNNYKWKDQDKREIEIDFVIDKAQAVISNFTMSGWMFGEAAATPTATANFGEIVYTYYSGETKLANKPTDAGSYKVVATIAGTNNFFGDDKELTFTISKAEVEVPTIGNQFYSGTELIGDVDILEGVYIVSTPAKGTNVGIYKATLTIINSNYKWKDIEDLEIEVDFEVEKGQAIISNFTMSGWTYGRDEETPAARNNFGEIVYTYYLGETKLANKPTDAGSYKVVATITETNNFYGDEKELNFTISKAEVDSPNINPAIYSGENLIAAIEETKLYSVKTNNGGVEIGEYPVELTLKNFNNYKWKDSATDTLILMFEITKAINVWSPEPSLPEKWTYGQTVNEPVISAEFGTVKTIYSIQNVENSSFEGMPTAPGKYNVIFYVEGTKDYSALSKSINFEIEKIKIDIPTIEGKNYDGIEFVSTFENTDTYIVKNITALNVGTYGIVFTIIDTNYMWSNGSELTYTLNYVISLGKAEISNFTMSGWTYGEEQATPSADKNLGTIQYSYISDKDGSVSFQKPTNVGNYQVVATIAATNNYEGDRETLPFEIKQGKAEISEFAMTGWVYDGTAKNPSGRSTLGNINFKYFNEEMVEISAPTDAGTYKVQAYVEDDINGNYLGDEESSITYTISKYQPTISNFTMSDGWTYGEDKENPTATKDFEECEIEFAYYNSEGTEIAAPTDAGDYFVKAFIAEGRNNFSAETEARPFTIAPFVVEDIPTLANPTYTGDSFSSNVAETEYYTVENVSATNAGSYEVKLTLKSSNYSWGDEAGEEKTLYFVINKAQAVISNFTMSGWIYGEEEQSPTAETNFGVAKFRYSQTEFGQYEANKPSDVGTYFVEAYIENDPNGNYIGTSEKKSFTISKGKATISNFTMSDGWTYGDNTVEPEATKNLGEIVCTYYLGETKLANKPTDAGTYKVVLTIEGCGNYDGDSVEKTYTISKYQPTISNFIMSDGWTYGEDKETPTATKDFEECEIEFVYYNSEGTEISAPTDAGDYFVKAFIAEGRNNFSAETEARPFTIAPFVVEDIPTLVTPTYTGDSFSSNVAETEYYTVENVSATNAGRYEVKLTLKSSNYSWGDEETDEKILYFVINKAQAVISNFTMSGWTYGEEEQSPTAETNFGEVEFRYFSGEQEISKPSNAGSYFVEAYIEEDSNGNYLGCVSTTKLSFTISKCAPEIVFPTYDVLYLSNKETSRSYKTAPTATVKGESVVGSVGEFEIGEIIYKDGEKQSTIQCSFVPYDNHKINYEGGSTTINVTVKTVAQINSVYYPTIELALAAAQSNDVVYVLPDITEKVKISNSVTVNANVTLVFLYGDIASYSEYINNNTFGKATATDKNAPKENATSVIIVEENVVITNNGIIDIMGVTSGSGGGAKYAGQTSGDYAELQMKNNSKIINNTNNSQLRVTGFITDMSNSTSAVSQVVVNKGSMGLPFVVRDFKGGSYMNATTGTPKRVLFGQILSRTSQECAPFNQYQFMNLSSKLRVNYNGTLYGYANLYAGSQQNFSNIKFVGKDSDAVLSFNTTASYIESKYDPTTEICDLDIYGGIDLKAMSLEVKLGLTSKQMSTDDVYFPINWRFDISLNKASTQNSASYDLQKKLKLLPGAKITIGEKVEATFANVSIYTNEYKDTCMCQTQLNYGIDINGNDMNLLSAEVVVNGSMICNSLGGNITSNTTNASVKINNSCTMITKETTEAMSGSNLSAQINFREVETYATLSGEVKSATGTYYYNATTKSWSTTKVAV